MAISFPSVSPRFRAEAQVPVKTENVSAPQNYEDRYIENKSSENTTPKKGFFKRVKDGFTSFRKGLVDFGYMAGGAIKGAVYGAAAGVFTVGAIAVRNMVKKAPTALGWKGKVLAGTVGLATMGITMFKAKLDANQRKSEIDHRWGTEHSKW